MFIHNIDPVLLSIGPLHIRYYGLVYVIGFLLGIWYLKKLADEKEIDMTKDQVYDLFTWLIVGVVVGGRLMHVIFYDPAYYIAHPLEIFFIWEGGMAFHGGAIGVAIAVWLYTRKHKIDFYEITDALVLPASLVLALGRISNFLNGELVGKVTEVAWAFKFRGYDGFRHPSQLYESVKNIVIFGVLMFVRSFRPKKGVLTWSFVLAYGVLRFIVEYWKEPEWIWLSVSAGQWLSIVMISIGAYMLFRTLRSK